MSKALSWILRHGAAEVGLAMRKDGYVKVAELMEVGNIKSKLGI